MLGVLVLQNFPLQLSSYWLNATPNVKAGNEEISTNDHQI